jgi:tetratricopeptide (TPR) repeat protein
MICRFAGFPSSGPPGAVCAPGSRAKVSIWRVTSLFLLLYISAAGQSAQDPRSLSHPLPSSVPPSQKKALLIGNQAYADVPLRNPANDAIDLARALMNLGFETQVLTNMGKVQMQTAVDSFAARLSPGDVGIFFYAGHGFQLDNENYLVPVDYSAHTGVQAKAQSIRFSNIKSRLEATPARLIIMVLDACRDNPFQVGPDGKTTNGLALLEAGLGSYIAFSASPGKTAEDNPDERNGLFTKFLLEDIREPVGVAEIFRRVRKEVYGASSGNQLPYLHDQMIADVRLQPSPDDSSPDTALKATDAAKNEPIEEGKRLYNSGGCSQAAALFEALVRNNPSDPFAQNALGLADYCLSMNVPALDHFTLAMRLRPAFAAAYLNRGRVFLKTAQYELAYEDFTWAVEAEPENGLFLRNRADALFGMRKYEDAIRDFDKAIAVDSPESAGYFGRAKVLYRLGKFREALADYDSAIARKRDFSEAYAGRAQARDQLGDRSGAAQNRRAAQTYSARK